MQAKSIDGYCECGCGEKVRWRFVRGHQHRHPQKPERYRVEDRGYETPCWTWLLSLGANGYGQVRHHGKSKRAHRFYYEQTRGPIPAELQLDHLCQNRDCVNPWHLEPVTQAENSRRGKHARLTADMARQIRDSTGSPKIIAAQFGVRPNHVHAIRRGDRWG